MPHSGNRIARSCQVLAALACAGAALAAGCGGADCTPYTTRCQGDDGIQVCDPGGESNLATPHWRQDRCPVACRVVDGEAFCAGSAEPVAVCEGAAHEICFAGQPAQCRGGYPVPHVCPTSGTHCVMSPSCGAVCAVDDVPDPRCTSATFCDGGDQVTCNCGLIVFRYSCGGPDLCHQMGSESYCTPSSTPDPRCADPGQQSSGFCSENTAHVCWFGFVISSTSCTPGSCVAPAAQPATCESP